MAGYINRVIFLSNNDVSAQAVLFSFLNLFVHFGFINLTPSVSEEVLTCEILVIFSSYQYFFINDYSACDFM